MDTPVAELSPAQRSVLVALKRQGEATADELAGKLNISSSAVRQHLVTLRAADVVASRREHGQPGRPADRFFTTERAEAMFAHSDAQLSIEILRLVDQEDPSLVGRIFDRRRDQLVNQAQDRIAGRPTEECVDVVTQLLDEQGYLADVEVVEPGHYRINLHSCAIWNVARQFRTACQSELAFIQDLLPEARVGRTTHKTAGAHTCAYDIYVDH